METGGGEKDETPFDRVFLFITGKPFKEKQAQAEEKAARTAAQQKAAEEKAAADAKAKAEAEAKAKAEEKAELKAEILAELKAAGVIPAEPAKETKAEDKPGAKK